MDYIIYLDLFFFSLYTCMNVGNLDDDSLVPPILEVNC